MSRIEAAVAIVEYKGKILLGKKIHSKSLLSKTWHIPGGKKRPEETYAQALIREIEEEANIKIQVLNLIDEFSNKEMRVKWYICRPQTTMIKPGDDLADVKFVPKEDVIKLCDEKAISLWPPKVKEYFFQNL